MTMRTIPGASAISEFFSAGGVRFTGTCGETAGLAAAHVVDPAKYPLNDATLYSITQWEIAKGQASSNGSESIGAIASWLASVGLNHTNYGFSQPFTGVDWRALLAQWGGIKPIIFEYARAGAGLPGDESGVNYHFNACLAWDPTGLAGLFADGDNWRAQSDQLSPYTLANLETAQVCGVLVLDYELGGTAMSGIPQGWTDANSVLSAPNGKTVSHGFRDYVLTHSWDAADVPQSEEVAVAPLLLEDARWGGGNLQYFRDSALMYAPNPQGVGSPNYIGAVPVGAELGIARQQMATAQGQVQTLSTAVHALDGQLATAQQQVSAVSAQLQQADSDNATLTQQMQQQQATAAAQLAQLTSQIAALQAQIQQLQQQPPTPPPASQPPAPTYTPAQLVGLFIQAVYAEVQADIKAGTPPAGQ